MSERQLYPPPPELFADGPCISKDLPQLSPEVSDRDTVMLTLPLQLGPVQCTSTGPEAKSAPEVGSRINEAWVSIALSRPVSKVIAARVLARKPTGGEAEVTPNVPLCV